MNNNSVVISGAGLWTPANKISNEELVDAYNQYAEKYNLEHAQSIAAGEKTTKPLSSAEFITKASGIKSRFVYRKEGILDVDRMRPKFEARPINSLSHQAEMALNAAKIALSEANKSASDIDSVILSCAYTQRSHLSIAIEVQI